MKMIEDGSAVEPAGKLQKYEKVDIFYVLKGSFGKF